MKYLSLFSGIEAATVAWKPLGWTCVAVSEIEKFPCALLAHHYPDVPNLGDVTKITIEQVKRLGRIDLVVFGSPCQDLSIAGNRKGFDGERSSLFFAAIRIIQWAKQFCGCRFALWENVPGAFSSNKGADFAAVVEQMAGCKDIAVPVHGWGKEGAALGDDGMLEWSVLDAQWFGLAQRRKRVFAIVDFGNWFDRPPILLERQSLRGNPAQSGRKKQEHTSSVAKCLTKRGAGGQNQDIETANYVVHASGKGVTGPLLANAGTKQWLGNQEVFSGDYFIVHGTQDPIVNNDIAHCLGRNNGQENAVFCINGNIINKTENSGGNGLGVKEERAYTLTKTDRHAVCNTAATLTRCYADRGVDADQIVGGNCAIQSSQVRRLTPLECERLQGFPDHYTNIPGAADSPRYAALGNSMAVPVMRWIGERIQKFCGVAS